MLTVLIIAVAWIAMFALLAAFVWAFDKYLLGPLWR